ncbi:MAG: DUF1080 domain-containing protein [Planctomycetes bacterium]|nr:DUF1080 domain-containing protein [Planctomycetota bacterium]
MKAVSFAGLVVVAVGCWLAVGPDPTAVGNEAPAPDWRPLYDGRRLGDWKPTPFGGAGDVTAADGVLRIGMGADLSGVTWQGEFPRQSFEVELQARRVDGSDFFCGLTFPVGDDHCSLILGGWGGTVVGLSSVDGEDAANNPTTRLIAFEDRRWYAVRIRVTPDRITCFLDGEPIVDQPLEGHAISVRVEVEPSQPLGIATYATAAEVRNLRWRPIAAAGDVSPTPAPRGQP